MKMKLKMFVRTMIGSLICSVTKMLLGPHVFALLVKSDNGIFAVDPEDYEDYGVSRRLRKVGNWGTAEIERLRPHITPDSRILVVGAHIGTLAIPLAKISGKVVAIEANPRTYGLLVQNIALNSVANCTAINVAASDKDEEIKFLLSRANSGGSKRVPRNKEYMYYYDNPKEISVRAVSLDEHLEEKDFDIVIMDIEGSEYFALKGMQSILSKCKFLMIEFLPHHLRNVSCVTVGQFLSVIAPHFSRMTIPSRDKTVGPSEFLDYLSEMYENEEGDEGIVFEKA